MISIVAVKAPLKGSGTPARAALSKTNEVLNTSLAIFTAFDFDDACEGCNVDTSEAEAEDSVCSSARGGVDDLGKRIRINFLALSFKLLISSVSIQRRRKRRLNVPASCQNFHFGWIRKSSQVCVDPIRRTSQLIHVCMTRVTNFGIKRTYVQAGFSSDGAAEPTREGGNEDSETGRNIEPEGPPKKKRRDRKRKLNNDHDHEQTPAQNPKSGSFKSGTSAKGDRQDKNARRQASSESRRTKRLRERRASTTCFVCRKIGHAARECQTTAEDAGKSVVGICYRYAFAHFCTYVDNKT